MPPLEKKIMWVMAALLALDSVKFLVQSFFEVGSITHFGGDFLVFFSTAQRLAHHEFSAIYDAGPLRHARAVQFKGDLGLIAPFPYPPYALFIVWPLGFLSYGSAVTLWSLLPAPFYFGLVALLMRRSQRGMAAFSFSGSYLIVAAALLPLFTANVLSGQTGNGMAALFLAVLYFWKRRPLLCGLCAGLLAVKPQLGLLLPFALLAARQWAALLMALATFLALALASLLCFGAPLWADYLQLTPLFTAYLEAGMGSYSKIALSPYISLRAAGLPAGLALPVQGAIACALIALIMRLFRREDGPLDLRCALLACATPLAAPYALFYDTPLLAAAIIPLLVRALHRGWSNPLEVLSFIAILLLPYEQVAAVRLHLPFTPSLLLALLFIVLFRRCRAESPPSFPYSP